MSKRNAESAEGSPMYKQQPHLSSASSHQISSRFTNSSYTIGWLCASEVELAATQAPLDERHPELLLGKGDSNAYVLGQIG